MGLLYHFLSMVIENDIRSNPIIDTTAAMLDVIAIFNNILQSQLLSITLHSSGVSVSTL